MDGDPPGESNRESTTGESTVIDGVEVRGLDVGPETRCAHYGSERDVVAIRFACCGEYYPCYRCHDALANHEREVWPRGDFEERAVLCGACGSELRIAAYLEAADACPSCGAGFNPGCREHRHLYFETGGT